MISKQNQRKLNNYNQQYNSKQKIKIYDRHKYGYIPHKMNLMLMTMYTANFVYLNKKSKYAFALQKILLNLGLVNIKSPNKLFLTTQGYKLASSCLYDKKTTTKYLKHSDKAIKSVLYLVFGMIAVACVSVLFTILTVKTSNISFNQIKPIMNTIGNVISIMFGLSMIIAIIIDIYDSMRVLHSKKNWISFRDIKATLGQKVNMVNMVAKLITLEKQHDSQN